MNQYDKIVCFMINEYNSILATNDQKAYVLLNYLYRQAAAWTLWTSHSSWYTWTYCPEDSSSCGDEFNAWRAPQYQLPLSQTPTPRFQPKEAPKTLAWVILASRQANWNGLPKTHAEIANFTRKIRKKNPRNPENRAFGPPNLAAWILKFSRWPG